MEQTYQYLLSLEFRHGFFKDGRFKSLQITLDDESSRLCKNLGIILKPFHGGVHFLAQDPQLLNDVTLNTPIRIFLTCNDPYYINYSELPDYRPSDTVLYFNNLDSVPNAQRTGLQLHQKDYIGQNDVAQLSFGKLAILNFDNNKTYHFEDIFENNVSDYIRPSQNELGGFLVSNLLQGIIKVFANGQEEERVYYYPRSVWKKPLGIIELYAPALFEQYDQSEKQTYTLNFDTKKTIWKYFLMGDTYQELKKLSIVGSNEDTLFNATQNPQNEEDDHWAFESQNPIPLSEYSEVTYKLMNDGEEPPVIKSLPIASAEQLYFDNETSNESMYSHIYI